MPLFSLIAIWAALGILISALALAARLKPASWSGYGWLWMFALGAGSAICGGLIGWWLFGRLFSTATALWIGILVLCMPQLFTRLRAC